MPNVWCPDPRFATACGALFSELRIRRDRQIMMLVWFRFRSSLDRPASDDEENFRTGRSWLAGLARGRDRFAAATPHQHAVLSDRRGSADEIALHRVTALIRKEPELLLGFHALGDDRHFGHGQGRSPPERLPPIADFVQDS